MQWPREWPRLCRWRFDSRPPPFHFRCEELRAPERWKAENLKRVLHHTRRRHQQINSFQITTNLLYLYLWQWGSQPHVKIIFQIQIQNASLDSKSRSISESGWKSKKRCLKTKCLTNYWSDKLSRFRIQICLLTSLWMRLERRLTFWRWCCVMASMAVIWARMSAEVKIRSTGSSLMRLPASMASSTPVCDRGTSTHPVNRFFEFQSDSPWRIRINADSSAINHSKIKN